MDGDASVSTNRETLRGYVERVARLHDERDELNGDIREVYKEAKEAGFDTTILREIVREFRVDADARITRYNLLNDYRQSLGMLVGTPLGDYAEEQATPRRRGRPRKIDAAIDAAREHLGNGPDWATGQI